MRRQRSLFPSAAGTVVTGTVYNTVQKKLVPVPSVTTGADANTLVGHAPSQTPPFAASSPAAAVITSQPTTYVRVYTPGNSNPAGGWIANSDAIRGLDAAKSRTCPRCPTCRT